MVKMSVTLVIYILINIASNTLCTPSYINKLQEQQVNTINETNISENILFRKIKQLEEEKNALFKEINKAIDESIIALKTSNVTNAERGVSYIQDLKKHVVNFAKINVSSEVTKFNNNDCNKQRKDKDIKEVTEVTEVNKEKCNHTHEQLESMANETRRVMKGKNFFDLMKEQKIYSEMKVDKRNESYNNNSNILSDVGGVMTGSFTTIVGSNGTALDLRRRNDKDESDETEGKGAKSTRPMKQAQATPWFPPSGKKSASEKMLQDAQMELDRLLNKDASGKLLKERLARREKMKSQLQEWIKMRQLENQNLKKYKASMLKKFGKLEPCPRNGIGKRAQGVAGLINPAFVPTAAYPCCRKCCKKSFMGCL